MGNDSIGIGTNCYYEYPLDFRENRYLLLLTENYSALRILEQTYLTDRDPVILFGSSFPEDINYTQVTIRAAVIYRYSDIYRDMKVYCDMI